MSYSAIQALLFGKKPVWLYEFVTGPTRVYLVARSEDLVTVPDMFALDDVFAVDDVFHQVWTASPVQHSRLPYATEPGKSAVEITFPNSDTFARQFLLPLGIDITTVTIRRMFLNDPDLQIVVKYRGQFTSVRPSEQRISLEFDAEAIDLAVKALPRVMQRPCPYAVYFGGCGLDLADHQSPVTVTAVEGADLTVTEASGEADGFYASGIIQWGDYREMVVSHSGTSLSLIRPLPGLEDYVDANGSATVQLAPGCDLSPVTCDGRFGNILNYGGFPFMSDNPIDGRSIV